MTGYNYTGKSKPVIKRRTLLFGKSKPVIKRRDTSFWEVVICHKERGVTITLKEVSALFMAGYNYTKRSVHSLHDWLQLY
jgi:hypothetical protein